MKITISYSGSEDDNLFYYNSFENLLKTHDYDDIKFINCNDNNLEELPRLPANLHSLNCMSNNLTCLPELPESLIYLNCSNNKFKTLPKLPSKLEILHCWDNNLYCLPPILPRNLEWLSCSCNNLYNLPKLPNKIKHIMSCFNNLVYIPELPDSLKYLDCSSNKLESLPTLPDSLEYLCVVNNTKLNQFMYENYNHNWEDLRLHQKKIREMGQRAFANKIGMWFLECKYNPEYLYCKNRLINEYNELYY